jgi:hypothetical protein
VDLATVIILPLSAALVVYVFKLPFIVASFLIFGLPAIYLSYKRPQIIKKSLIFTVLIVSSVSWFLDHMAFLDLSWHVPNSAWRILGGTIPIEDITFGLFWTYFGVIFWEYFLDHDKNKKKINPKFRYLIAMLGTIAVIFFTLYFVKSGLLTQQYFYLKFGLTFILPVIIFTLFKFPKLIRKIFALGVYFFSISIVGEYVGLAVNHWNFPGVNYVATTRMAGQIVPWEELIFWVALGMPGLICWYELFADDRK